MAGRILSMDFWQEIIPDQEMTRMLTLAHGLLKVSEAVNGYAVTHVTWPGIVVVTEGLATFTAEAEANAYAEAVGRLWGQPVFYADQSVGIHRGDKHVYIQARDRKEEA